MAAVITKYVRDGITYYEIRGALPDGKRYRDRVGFSEGEMRFRALVARRIVLMRNDYLSEIKRVGDEIKNARPRPGWMSQLIF